jgi:hypothetical protein
MECKVTIEKYKYPWLDAWMYELKNNIPAKKSYIILKIEQQSKNSLKTWITKDNSSIPITISPREPRFITMLVESIPIEDSFGPASSTAIYEEDWLEAIKSLTF